MNGLEDACRRCGAPLSYAGQRYCVDCDREMSGWIPDPDDTGDAA